MNRKKLLILILGLFIFHMAVSSLFYYVSVKGYFPAFNNGRGIWNYAQDSNGYHKEALKIVNELKGGGFFKWWRLTPNHWHVKSIALSYKVFKPVPLSMAPLNAFIWVMSFLLVLSIAYKLVGSERIALAVAFLFSFFPSNLMDSIQLLQDPFYVLGALLFILGWIWIWRLWNRCVRRSVWNFVLPVIFVGIGYYMVVMIRFYLLTIWLGMALVFYLFSLVKNPRHWIASTLMIGMVFILFSNLKPMPVQLPKPTKPTKPLRPKYPWTYSKWVPDTLEFQFVKIAQYREGFCTCCPHAGSNIDTNVRFHSMNDILWYLPRTVEIGFLAPFPDFWFKKAKTSGRISRFIVGGEMILIYFLYVGIFLWIFKRRIQPEMLMLFFWSFGFILMFSLVVVNLGTLHRMRHIYLLPVFIFGVSGWGLLFGQD